MDFYFVDAISQNPIRIFTIKLHLFVSINFRNHSKTNSFVTIGDSHVGKNLLLYFPNVISVSLCKFH